MRADLGWVPQFAQNGVLVPLSDSMSDYKALAAKDYDGNVATNLYQGKYYGLPLDTNTRVLITDQAALAKAGVTQAPATFADLQAMADKLKGTGVSLFADSGLGAWNISPWIWSGGGELTNAKETKATGYLNSATNVKTIQMLVDWYGEGLIPNLITGNAGATGTSDGLPKTDYATIFDGPWMSGIWAGQYPTFKPDLLQDPGRPRRLGQRRRRRGHRADRELQAPGGGGEVHPLHPELRLPAGAW